MHADDNDDRPSELKDLPREIAPPAGLRNRIETDLGRRGLVTSARPVLARRAAMILLPLLGFVAGWLLRPAGDPAHSHDGEQPRFILLLYGGTDSPSDDGVREYGDWARRLAASGTDVSGEKLADDSELLVGAPLHDPARANLRGFFIVQAADVQRAQRLAVSHPHVKRGGTIVVRRIDPT
jgi:hypothetical protein